MARAAMLCPSAAESGNDLAAVNEAFMRACSVEHEAVASLLLERSIALDAELGKRVKDYRWNSTAQGWALYGKKDEKMAQWLEDAERQREQRAR